jgi:hypothetical protein
LLPVLSPGVGEHQDANEQYQQDESNLGDAQERGQAFRPLISQGQMSQLALWRIIWKAAAPRT